MTFELKIEPILENELYTTPPLMQVVVAKINGTRQDIPKVFSLTRDEVSIADLKHLRRIRYLPEEQMECIIAKLGPCDRAEKSEIDLAQELLEIEKKYAASADNMLREFRIVSVPSSAPKTNHQLKACASIWPCKFAKNNYLIQCIEGTNFSRPERLVLDIIVNTLVQHIQTTNTKQHRRCSSGAIVFRYARVYGIGLSGCELVAKNPVKHSAMVAIDSVAKQAGSGHWTDEPDPNNSCCIVDLMSSLQGKLDEQVELKDHQMSKDFLPYLCTNYDIFLTEEPCMMCTMGLVQSRIRRLFYLSDKDRNDSKELFEKVCYPDKAIEDFLVHRDRNLNHRFEAWRISLLCKQQQQQRSNFVQ